MSGQFRHGLVVGKFYPPHRVHQYLSPAGGCGEHRRTCGLRAATPQISLPPGTGHCHMVATAEQTWNKHGDGYVPHRQIRSVITTLLVRLLVGRA